MTHVVHISQSVDGYSHSPHIEIQLFSIVCIYIYVYIYIYIHIYIYIYICMLISHKLCSSILVTLNVNYAPKDIIILSKKVSCHLKLGFG